MAFDIVFPNDNEEEFIVMAQKLGYGELYLTYEYSRKSYNDVKKNFIALKQKNKFKVLLALKIKPNEITETKKLAQLFLVESSDENRWVVEKNSNIMIYNLEYQKKNDFMHHRNSGLNHILCTFAHQNKIKISVSFSGLLNAKDNMKSIILGRIRQNARLCRKYKVLIVLVSFAFDVYCMRAPFDLTSFGASLGIPPKQ
jgi:RNase P/RNase MRP subunit p30